MARRVVVNVPLKHISTDLDQEDAPMTRCDSHSRSHWAMRPPIDDGPPKWNSPYISVPLGIIGAVVLTLATVALGLADVASRVARSMRSPAR